MVTESLDSRKKTVEIICIADVCRARQVSKELMSFNICKGESIYVNNNEQ